MANTVEKNSIFYAKWDNTTQHLKVEPLTLTQKIKKIAYLIISIVIPIIGLIRLIGYGLSRAIKAVLLPSRWSYSKEEMDKASLFLAFMVKHYSGFDMEEKKIVTPDGATIDVTFLKNRSLKQDLPVQIYFNGNGELSKSSAAPFFQSFEALKSERHFVFFDYRGVGNSKGAFNSSNDLVLDGASVVQWLQREKNVAKENIQFHGFSLGGAIASKTQSLDEKLTGEHLNNRSFSSVQKVITAKLGGGVIGRFLGWIAKKYGLDIDAADSLEKIKGKKLVIYHKKDGAIPYEASMAKSVKTAEVFELPSCDDEEIDIYFHHAPFGSFLGAQEKVTEFFSRKAPDFTKCA